MLRCVANRFLCLLFLLELWRVSGTQDPLLLLTPSCKLPLFSCIPGHPSCPVQTGVGLHHMGLQTHHEECGWHWAADPLHTAAERSPGGGSGSELLPDLFLWHPPTHLLCGDWHVPHCWWVPVFRSKPIRNIEPFFWRCILQFSSSLASKRYLKSVGILEEADGEFSVNFSVCSFFPKRIKATTI